MVKRCLDVIVALVLVVASLPVVGVMAVVLAFELRAWPFFVQQRVGRGGRRFTIVKMRTLPPVAPEQVDKYQLRGLTVPPVARCLRALHLDEIPQLWLVLAGRMSLVGPRPEMPHLVERMPGSLAEMRHRVRPGCTGLWQISPAAEGLIHEHPEYDLAYVQHASLRLDLWILWQTLLVMLLGHDRSVTLDAAPLPQPVAVGGDDALTVDLDGISVSVPSAGAPVARERVTARWEPGLVVRGDVRDDREPSPQRPVVVREPGAGRKGRPVVARTEQSDAGAGPVLAARGSRQHASS